MSIVKFKALAEQLDARDDTCHVYDVNCMTHVKCGMMLSRMNYHD